MPLVETGADQRAEDETCPRKAEVRPAMAVVIIGQRIRKKLSEQIFRRVIFVSILVLGVYIIPLPLG